MPISDITWVRKFLDKKLYIDEFIMQLVKLRLYKLYFNLNKFLNNYLFTSGKLSLCMMVYDLDSQSKPYRT